MQKLSVFISFFLIFFISNLLYAQLGEQAGPLYFNVSLGGSQTVNYTVLNGGSTPISFTIILPQLNTIAHNATPTVTVSPMNGTLAPHSQQVIHVAVQMPSSDKPGLTWNGAVQVVEATPSQVSSGMGAVVYAGVLKAITVVSAQPKFNLLLFILIIAIIIVVVALALLAYYYKVIVPKRTKRAVARAKELTSVKASISKKKSIGKAKPKAKAKQKAKPKARAKKSVKGARRRRARR